MIDERSQEMIRTYLGDAAAAGGPFAILGVGHGPLDRSIILRACQARLAQINGHPRSQTQSADDVRMAVHAAASQLMDPVQCAELAKVWPEGTDELGGVGESPTAWRAEGGRPVDAQLIRQAMTLVGACGGWNAQSRKRLGQFARLNALSASQLVGGIVQQGLGGDIAADSEARRSSVGLDTGIRGPSLMDPREDALPWGVIPAAYMLMALSLLLAGVLAFDGAGLRANENQASAAGSTASTLRVEERDGPSDSGSGDRTHYSAILFELNQFAREGVRDQERGEEFSSLCLRLVGQWTEFPEAELDQAVDIVQQVLEGVLSAELFDACTTFLQSTDGQRSPLLRSGLRAWLFGGFDQEPSYSLMTQRARADNEWASFDDALVGAFLAAAEDSVDDPAWWSWWIGELAPMRERIGVQQHDSLLLSAAYQRMVDPAMGQEWDRCVQQLVQSIGWGSGSTARSWMMGVVVDPRVQSDRLAIFIRGMVLYSSAQGLGMDMMLAGDETIAEREAYLSKIRSRWSSESGDDSDIRQVLIERIKSMVQMTRQHGGGDQAMIRCVELARINSAAWAFVQGDQAMVFGMMQSIEDPMGPMDQSSREQVRGIDLSSSERDVAWATQARNLESPEDLKAHLNALDRDSGIGPKSGHALLYLAMSAPNLSVRADAEQAIMRRPDEPAILIAMDRVIGSERVSRRVVELVNSYVGFNGSSLESEESRRAILRRLSEIGMLRDRSGDGAVHRFEYSMMSAYTQRLVTSDQHGAGSVYRVMRHDLIRRDEDVPREIQHSLMVRLRRSDGPIQKFSSYQAAIAELQAHQLIAQQPGLTSRVRRVVADMSFRAGSAQDVFELMLIYERAMAELWMLALELEAVS
ncbi:MAG: hypothetical protein JJ974_05230 [Phycisphaerales bacterium]|nr:hypothetical protein [Phycisphaerales bacterium]